MLKKISLVLVALTISTLGARLVAWITGDPKAPVLSGKQITLIAIFFFLFVALSWVLETQKAISFNWPWHRRRFFREMSKVGTLGTERILKDPNESEDAVFIDVLEDGKRKNLVNLLHERLKNRDKPRRILILGEAGSGKSTALKQLRREMLRDGTKHFGLGKPIPILAPLGRYKHAKLLDYTRDIFSRESRKLSAVMEKLLQEGRIVVLLDALDEALGSNALSEINDLLSTNEYRHLAVVITGRRGEYEKDLPADMEIFSVQDLSDQVVLTLCRLFVATEKLPQTPSDVFSTLEDNQLLIDGGLGRNPFWLQLILKGETFSNSKTAIFAAALKALFDREWNRVGSKRLWVPALPKDEQFLHSRNSLAALAEQISVRQQGEQIDGEDALKVIEKYLSRQTRIEKLRPQDILWLAKDELLINFDDLAAKDRWPPVRFRHRLIREYLTAVELSSNSQLVLTVFGQHAGNVNWWETLLMLRTLAADELKFKKHNDLFDAAIANSQDPHRLFFAIAMLDSFHLSSRGPRHPTVDALGASLRQGITSSHVEAAASVGNIAPNNLVDFVKNLLDQNDPSLAATVKDLLKRLFLRQASDKGSSTIFAAFLGNPFVYNFAQPILVELGDAVTLRVIDVLRDSEFSARWHAAEVLGDIGDTRAVEPLIELLSDSNDTVQRSAVQSLGKLKDVRALLPLAKTFSLKGDEDGDSLLKPTIVKALGNFGPAAIDELISMLKSDDLSVVPFARMSLRQIGPVAGTALIDLLNYNSMFTRGIAVKLLGEFQQVEAIDPLIRLLNTEDPIAKIQAAESLALIGAPAVEPLIAALTGKDLELRRQSAKVLGKIGDKRSIEPLIGILKNRDANDSSRKSHAETLVRIEAAEALGNIGDVVALDALREAKEKDRLVVGLHAMASLAQLGDEEQLDGVHGFLEYNDPNVQHLAVVSLGRVKSPRSLSYLERYRKIHKRKLVSTDGQKGKVESTRDEALSSIATILEALVGPSDPRPQKDLADVSEEPAPVRRDLRGYEKALQLEDQSVRLEAAKALAEIGEEAVDLLLVALKDPDPEVRIAAVIGLGKFGGEVALSSLTEILKNDSKNTVRRTAAESLGNLGLPAAIEPLKQALADEYLLVNIGAAIGLHRLGVPGMVNELESILQRNKAPALRLLNAHAHVLLGDFKAIPYLEQSLKEWQEEGVAREDTSYFESASAKLTQLRKMQQDEASQAGNATAQSNTVEPAGIWTRLRRLFRRTSSSFFTG